MSFSARSQSRILKPHRCRPSEPPGPAPPPTSGHQPGRSGHGQISVLRWQRDPRITTPSLVGCPADPPSRRRGKRAEPRRNEYPRAAPRLLPSEKSPAPGSPDLPGVLPSGGAGRLRRPGHGFGGQRHGGGARVGADPAEAGRAGVHLPGAVSGPGGRAESRLGHGRPSVLPVPVGVLPETRQLGHLALRVHAQQRLADCYSGFALGRCCHHSHCIPGGFDFYLRGISKALLQTCCCHAFCSSCFTGLQLGPLPNQVH